ncbi:MAG: type III pantothenate kinase [Pseudomonadota bacterium]
MLLAIDAGNTNIVFAVFDGESQKCIWRIHTDRARTADEYTSIVSGLYREAGLSCEAIKDVIISSVVPSANPHLAAFCKAKHNIEPRFINAEDLQGRVHINLEQPDKVGADRIVNAVAVCKFYQTPAVVVDFGTATTFDVINEDNVYEGGIIAPGINLSSEALHKAAAQLPMVGITKTETVIGKNTAHAMESGIYWGYVGLIEGMLKRIESELGIKPFVIGTGGLAPLFSEGTDVLSVIDQELTVKGLLEIYKNE